MEARRVLILGGSGFMGRSLARRLSRTGWHVQLVARSQRSNDWVSSGVDYHQGSYGDAALVKPLLAGTTWVVHLACDTVPGSQGGPAFEGIKNLLPTLQLLELLHTYTEARLLFVSTGGAIYGNACTRPAVETAMTSPLSYYAAGKASIEAFINAFSHLNSRDTVILRPSNVYGPGQAIRAGFGIVPALFKAAIKGQAFDLWGHGDITRDFLYIEDFVDLCVGVLDAPKQSGARTYNAGSGAGCSLNNLVRMVEQVSGRTIDQVHRPARLVDVNYIVLDNGKIQREIGWSPKTRLLDGLGLTWQWFTEAQR